MFFLGISGICLTDTLLDPGSPSGTCMFCWDPGRPDTTASGTIISFQIHKSLGLFSFFQNHLLSNLQIIRTNRWSPPFIRMFLILVIFWFLRLFSNSVSPSISASLINHFTAPPRGGRPLGAVVAALYNNDLDSGGILVSPAQH